MIPVMPSTGPSRRALLRAGLVGIASAGLLSGCSGDRVRTPWSPEPTVDEADAARRMPDGDLLLRARERLAGHRAALSRAQANTPAVRAKARSTATLWQTQQERLEQLLALGGITLPELDVQILTPSADEAAEDADRDGEATTGGHDGDEATGDHGAATTAPGSDDARQTAAGPAPRTVGEGLLADLPEVLEDLSRSSALNRAMLVSLAAQHVESARLLGAPVEWPPLEGPVGAAAVPVLARTRPAVFGLEVVAARSREDERLRYESVLAAVRSTTRALTTLAGDAAPLPPLGYDLPEPLEDEPDRLALARALVHDIEPAVLSVVDRAGSDVEQLRSLVRLVAETQQWAHELDVDPDPFPGMTLPAA
ncbi:DUF4439 domain-containing protein [Ornithinimicrobium sufpigmenti]|uniref:DUF4439 domain-containing protein n=1 Tax=Ornithinimicrobium sufpigmenti TaxID=2508882 RepID=UPI001036DAC7|nr:MULTISPECIES: DUF4439 domain-containing protein [unclassified Ornithinimicrobium]